MNMNMNSKRGEMGTSTLIILIASIFLAMGTVFIIFAQMDFLTTDSFTKVKDTTKFVSKGIEIVAIDAYDGSNNYFDEYYLIIQMLPDSAEIDFRRTHISLETSQAHSLLEYRNGTPSWGGGGYETFASESLDALSANVDVSSIQINPGSFRNLNFDIDGDGNTNDLVGTCDNLGTLCDLAYSDSALVFSLTTGGIQYAWLNDTSGTLLDISPGGAVPVDIDYSPIGDGTYGFVSTYGTKDAFTPHVMTPTGPFYIYADPIQLSNDVDSDGSFDFIVTNDTHLRIFPSSQKTSIDIALGGDISGGVVALSIDQVITLDNGTDVGRIQVSGSASGGVIPDSAIKIIPVSDGVGFYQIEDLIQSDNHLPHRLVRGEVVKVYIDSPHRMYANENIRFNFITSEGVSFPITAFTGHTIPSAQYQTIYPKI